MIGKEFRLDSQVFKVTETLKLWKTEKGIIEISENTLAIPVKLKDELQGYVFHGQGKLLLDAIVETEEGAVGKSVEKELEKPFLMLGDAKEIQQYLTKAGEQDFAKIGYKSQQEFIEGAEDLCDLFFRGRVHSHKSFNENHGLIFAFQNETSKFDLLVAKGSKLVYKARDMIFVSNRHKVVLKSPGEMVCTNNSRSVIIKK